MQRTIVTRDSRDLVSDWSAQDNINDMNDTISSSIIHLNNVAYN